MCQHPRVEPQDLGTLEKPEPLILVTALGVPQSGKEGLDCGFLLPRGSFWESRFGLQFHQEQPRFPGLLSKVNTQVLGHILQRPECVFCLPAPVGLF